MSLGDQLGTAVNSIGPAPETLRNLTSQLGSQSNQLLGLLSEIRDALDGPCPPSDPGAAKAHSPGLLGELQTNISMFEQAINIARYIHGKVGLNG